MEIARESVFVSALRSFFRCFFSIFGILAGILAFSFLYAMFAGPALYEEKTEFHILPDLNGNHDLISMSSPVILEIKIHGVIGEVPGIKADDIRNILQDSRSGRLANNRVKGILLHIDSPGGDAMDSNDIYHLIKRYKETFHVPVFAFVDGLCASGGMYIAASADQIFASPPSVIGSIGVIMGPFFNFSQAMDKVGIASSTLSGGLNKDMLNPFRPWKPDEDHSLKTVINFLYNQFVDDVLANRPNIDKTKLLEEYGAQVFDGPTAEKIGYIDHPLASYEDALTALLAAAQIKPEEHYQVVELKPSHSWLNALFCSSSPLFSGKVEHTLRLPNQKSIALRSPFAYLYEPGQTSP